MPLLVVVSILLFGCVDRGPAFEVVRLSEDFEFAEALAEPGRIDLSNSKSESILGSGWSFVEKKDDTAYVWGSGDPSEIVFFLSKARDLEVRLVVWPFAFPGAPDQVVTPVLNGEPLEAIRLPNRSQELVLQLEATGLRRGVNRLALHASSRHRPSEVLGGQDTRELAFALESVEIGIAPRGPAERDLERDLLRIPVGTGVVFDLDLPEQSSLAIAAVDRSGSKEAAMLEIALESRESVVLEREIEVPQPEGVTIALPGRGRSALHLTSPAGSSSAETVITLHSPRIVSERKASASSLRFVVPPSRAGLPEANMYSFGPSWGYLDGDEFPDLFIGHHYGHHVYGLEDLLLQNTGDGRFVNSETTIPPADPRFPRDLHAAVWAPFFSTSRDQHDLHIAVGGRRGDPSKRTEIEYLFLRNEAGKLIDRARELGLESILSKGSLLRGRLGIPLDYDQDGRLDLLLTGTRSLFRLLRGTESGFVDVSQDTGVGAIRAGDEGGWRASVADLDGDRYEDLILSAGPLSSLLVFLNSAGAAFRFDPAWTSSTTRIVASWARPTEPDGFPDLFLLPYDVGPRSPIHWIENPNGRKGRERTIDSRRIRGRGLQLTGADFDNDGDEDLVVLTREALYLLERRGESWIDVTSTSGLREIFNSGTEGVFSCVSMADYDLDGRLDLIATRGGGGFEEGPPAGPIVIARNTTDAGNWLRLVLRGRASNPLGLGAAIEIVHPDGTIQYRTVKSTISGTCQSDSAIHLGIGESAAVDLRVSWPSGIRSEHAALAANRRIEIEEPAGP